MIDTAKLNASSDTSTACLITRTTKRWSVSTEKNSVRDGLPVSGAEQADGKEVLK